MGFNAKPVIADTEEELNDVYAEPTVVSQKSTVRVIDNSSLHIHRLTTHDSRHTID